MLTVLGSCRLVLQTVVEQLRARGFQRTLRAVREMVDDPRLNCALFYNEFFAATARSGGGGGGGGGGDAQPSSVLAALGWVRGMLQEETPRGAAGPSGRTCCTPAIKRRNAT